MNARAGDQGVGRRGNRVPGTQTQRSARLKGAHSGKRSRAKCQERQAIRRAARERNELSPGRRRSRIRPGPPAGAARARAAPKVVAVAAAAAAETSLKRRQRAARAAKSRASPLPRQVVFLTARVRPEWGSWAVEQQPVEPTRAKAEPRHCLKVDPKQSFCCGQ
jgi:hypothetical protein